jgi:hypothetical protein
LLVTYDDGDELTMDVVDFGLARQEPARCSNRRKGHSDDGA